MINYRYWSCQKHCFVSSGEVPSRGTSCDYPFIKLNVNDPGYKMILAMYYGGYYD